MGNGKRHDNEMHVPCGQATIVRRQPHIHAGHLRDCAGLICRLVHLYTLPKETTKGLEETIIAALAFSANLRQSSIPFGCHISDVNLHVGGSCG